MVVFWEVLRWLLFIMGFIAFLTLAYEAIDYFVKDAEYRKDV